MAQFLDKSIADNGIIMNMERKDKYKMTLEQWRTFEVPMNDIFFNCSGSGKVDMGIYKWPRFGDPIINVPIGVSVSITPQIIADSF